jgi:hypothetical protein
MANVKGAKVRKRGVRSKDSKECKKLMIERMKMNMQEGGDGLNGI